MKLDKYNKEAEIIGETSSNAFSIDPKEAARVMNYLIDLYMDPIGSVVREITSNCIDAHRERDLKIAGKIDLEEEDIIDNFETRNTVLVKYTGQNSIIGIGASISFKDWGVGLSENRVANIYTKLGASTKRESNEEIGGFGIGCKSPFAYVSTFYITSVHNKVKRSYMLSRNNESPSMDMVYSEACEEKNSTEVVIPLKGTKDKADFAKAIDSQLTFFKSVLLENIREECGPVNTPEIIEEKDDYLITKGSGEVKALIGNVVYPLNNDQLDSFPGGKYFPLYIKFKIGEISIVPSREGIQYNEDTIASINSKISRITNKFKEDSILEMSEKTDIIDFIKTVNDIENLGRNRYRYNKTDGTDGFQSSTAIKCCFSDINKNSFQFKDWFPYDEGFSSFFKGLSISLKSRIFNQKYSGGVSLSDSHNLNFRNFSDKNIYSVENKCKRSKDINIAINGGSWIKISRTINSVLASEDIVKRDKIWALLMESSHVIDYDSIDLGDDVDNNIGNLDSEDEKRRLNKEVFGKYLCIDWENNLKWSRGNHKISELEKMEDVLVYGFPDDENLLRMVGNIYMNIKGYCNRSHYDHTFTNVSILKISQANEKYYMNHIYVKDFFMREHPIIKQWYTANIVKEALEKVGFLEHFKGINSKMYNLYETCSNYNKNNSCIGTISDGFEKELLSLCREHEIVDQDMMNKITTLINYCEDLDFLHFLDESNLRYPKYSSDIYTNKEKFVEGITDYLKLKGKDFDSRKEEEVELEEIEEMSVS